MQIPQEIIDQIRDRADIVDVVSRFVDLRRAGSNYKGLCPFHEEKTPSFNVNPDRQIFHCFGCGRGGNVFTFLMEMEGVTFPEAVRSLGKQYGVEVPDRQAADEAPSKNEGLYRVSDFAARWYHRQLLQREAGASARAYLASRRIPETVWETFQLGYAGPSWDGFARACEKKKVPISDLRQLKLIAANDRGGYRDYFRKRLMFPIESPSSRVIGFGARTMEADTEPKYLNSVDSPIYAKRRVLYGVRQAREAIRERREVIVVEGYTDAIALHVHGLAHVVASCGTALTTEHARLVRRLARRVVFMPDADAAGTEAALAAGAIFLGTGLEVRIVRLEEGMDPDEAVNALEPAEFEKKVSTALDYLEYLDYIMSVRPMSPRDKESLVQRVVTGLGSATDPLRYEVLVQDVARILKIAPEAIPRRRVSALKRVATEAQDGREARRVDRKRVALEKMLLRLLLEDTPEAAEARSQLDVEDFSEENCRNLYKLLDFAWENHIDITSSAFQKKAELVDLEEFAAEVSLIPIPPGNLGILLKDTVRRVKSLKIREELHVLSEKLQDLPVDSDEAVAVAKHYEMLKRALSEL